MDLSTYLLEWLLLYLVSEQIDRASLLISNALVLGTDRERHQTSAVLIFQFVGKHSFVFFALDIPFPLISALMFAISEIYFHLDFYQKRCVIKFNEPSRELSFPCQILLLQTGGAAFALLNTLIFIIIYIRITILVLKQPHGTFNLSNAMNFTC